MDKLTAYLMRKFRRGPERETQPSGHPSGAPRLGRRGLLASAIAASGGFVLGWLVPRQRPVESPYKIADVGVLYHRWSKPGYSQTMGAPSNWGGQPERYKTYTDAKRIALPGPHDCRGLSLAEAVGIKTMNWRKANATAIPLESHPVLSIKVRIRIH